jgi:tetratricopeptide (TPR) repeat protein
VIGKYMKEAMRLDAQARRLYGAKEYAMAVPLAKRALAIREKALGPEHPTVALSLNILGHFYFAQGRYKEAEPLHRKALAILEKKVGPNHADIVATLNSLASLNEKAGKRKEAAAFLERAEAMKKRLRGRK